MNNIVASARPKIEHGGDLYKVLDVHPNASSDEIKAAWRRRCQDTHPDRRGGDQEEFQDVQRAYSVLGDPILRAEYDATGTCGQLKPLEDEARTILTAALSDALRGAAVRVLAAAGESIRLNREKIKGQLANAPRRRRELVSKGMRIRRRSPGHDLVAALIDGEVDNIDTNIPRGQRAVEAMDLALTMLQAYEEDAPSETVVRWEHL